MERVLDGLDKFTTYFIKVRGKTSKMGNASKILNATTYEDSKYCVTVSGKKVLCLCKFNTSKLNPIISAPLFGGFSPAQLLLIKRTVSSTLRQKTQLYFYG